MSKSDPFAIVYVASEGQWVEYGRTETIDDNLSPAFVTAIPIDYYFEATQHLRVMVYDQDVVGGPLSAQEFLGMFETTLAAIMGSRGQVVVGRMVDGNGREMPAATFAISGEEIVEMKMELTISLSGRNLDKKDFFGKSDPFFEVARAKSTATSDDYHDAGKWVPVVRSNVIKKSLNPDWDPITVPLSKVVGGDIERRLLIRVYDWNKKSEPDFIGQVATSIPELQSLGPGEGLELINPKKARKKKKYRNSGVITVDRIELIDKPSFLDYIAGGCDISLVVGIDFTASNGNPAMPSSLHYASPYQPNAYVRAITSVGEVLANYDRDQEFPVFGYGAKLPPSGHVSHCFPLNGNPAAPQVVGVQGILAAYQQALQTVTLYGPTNFAPLIRAAATQASRHATQDSQEYLLLLIITDGIITDMDATTQAIVEASSLPMSIVIVGVGDADFDNMDVLDGDDTRLSYNGIYAERDIVQFVPFRDFAAAHPQLLATETLAEIPDQFLSYMTKHGISPNPHLPPPDTQIPSEPPPSYSATTTSPPSTYGF